ncbi:hypothetical protein [Aliiroseovarius sp. F20344]|uniref:hypothetical protein n=1 Tax=Aliiroseovarius sp. F20344 TaxID=2926414 RepID=UPI001FF33ED6|nr:hypothetical protein [Aliiroseovarius sp. F20344]MCK0142614.1 hypothetical protein [Aliiroseovarius sp. F20344]
MTHVLTLPPRRRRSVRLQSALLGLIERHGRWRVLRAALFARPSAPLKADDLSAHLRRDLNLPEDPGLLPSQRPHLL